MKHLILPSLKVSLMLLAANVAVHADDNIVENGDFEKKAAEGQEWPAGWAKPKAGGEWGKEGGNRFLSLKSSQPGEMVRMPGSPKAPNAGKDTSGWEEKKVSFLVTENSAFLKFMPCLFHVAAGTFDLDDVVIKKIDPSEVVPAKK